MVSLSSVSTQEAESLVPQAINEGCKPAHIHKHTQMGKWPPQGGDSEGGINLGAEAPLANSAGGGRDPDGEEGEGRGLN